MIPNAPAHEAVSKSVKFSPRVFLFICLLLFLLVFIHYAVFWYFLIRPEYVDLPELDQLAARVRLEKPVEVSRSWLREEDWNWPLGGHMFVLPEALDDPVAGSLQNLLVQSKAPAEPQWISRWFRRWLKAHNPGALKPAKAVSIATEPANRLGQALRDHGPLLVRYLDGKQEKAGIMIGDFTAESNHLALVMTPQESDRIAYWFISPRDVVAARAFPHPLRADWKAVGPDSLMLTVADPLGRSMLLNLPDDLKLGFDGLIQEDNEPGTYRIRPAAQANRRNLEIRIRHPYLMPSGGALQIKAFLSGSIAARRPESRGATTQAIESTALWE